MLGSALARRARTSLSLATALACSSAAALPPAPTAPACLADAGRVPFPGHSFPLDEVPSPESMNAVDAFPQLPSFVQPIFVTTAPDGTRRLFVVERAGQIRVFDGSPGASSVKTFLDIRAIVRSAGQEEGLLGLAFSPDYKTSGHFYLHYIAYPAACAVTYRACSKIVRYTVSSDPDVALPASETLILEISQPYDNHNGGMLAFGPDKYLYAGIGDGGDAGDPFDYAQNRASLLGKILRIDPRGGTPYAIPPGNPFAGNLQGWRPEIWAYGLRNPWRFSFDSVTGDLWIGDVGQNLWEEIDRLTSNDAGANLGWRACEGSHDYYVYSCASLGATKLPEIEYPHTFGDSGGLSVTGGYVYRGARHPNLFGAYVYADYVTGNVWAWTGSGSPTRIASRSGVSSFGQDADQELLLVGLQSGRLYRLDAAGGSSGSFPTRLSQTGLFTSTAALVPKPGMIEYLVNSPLWSDGSSKRRWLALPGSAVIDFDATGEWSFPVGTALVKHFELPTSATTTRRLETRVFLHQQDRWLGYTYRWNDAQTDADLVTTSQTATYSLDFGAPSTLTWTYPGPGDCMVCHNAAAGRVLGVRTRQLNLGWTCATAPGGVENQLAAWSGLGLFAAPLASPATYGAYRDAADLTAPLGVRARSYLETNCATCHQPLAPAPGGMDLRYDTALADMGLVDVPTTEGALGLVNPVRLAPGNPFGSMLWYRMVVGDPSARMPKGSRVPDSAAVLMLGGWIAADPTRDADDDGVLDGEDNCPGVANPGQQDVGGIGLGAAPDGIGDACQCGDVSGDGHVSFADVALLRRSLLVPTTAQLARPDLCDVGGNAGCSVGDATILQRALLTPPRATVLQQCAP